MLNQRAIFILICTIGAMHAQKQMLREGNDLFQFSPMQSSQFLAISSALHSGDTIHLARNKPIDEFTLTVDRNEDPYEERGVREQEPSTRAHKEYKALKPRQASHFSEKNSSSSVCLSCEKQKGGKPIEKPDVDSFPKKSAPVVMVNPELSTIVQEECESLTICQASGVSEKNSSNSDCQSCEKQEDEKLIEQPDVASCTTESAPEVVMVNPELSTTVQEECDSLKTHLANRFLEKSSLISDSGYFKKQKVLDVILKNSQVAALAMQLQAQAMAMQAQASGQQQMEGYPQMYPMQPRVFNQQPSVYKYGTQMRIGDQGLTRKKKMKKLMFYLQQLAHSGDQATHELLSIIDQEFNIIEHLLANNSGPIVDKIVQQRNEALRQSSPLVLTSYDMIIDLATTSGEDSTDAHWYHYFVKKGRGSKPTGLTNGKKKFLMNMMQVLQHHYDQLENRQRMVAVA